MQEACANRPGPRFAGALAMNAPSSREASEREELPLSKAAGYLVEECRMVLPGLQALFGFQLIAVFNSAFAEKLSSAQQGLHLLAIGLASIAIVLIMTPAALHRQQHPQAITRRFLDLSTRLLLWSMPPLALSICIDFYLIAQIIVSDVLGALLATGLVALFLTMWFVLPRSRRVQQVVGGSALGTSGFPLDGPALVAALRRGGYVIYLRHARTNPDQADTDPFHLDNTHDQRHLSAQGREDAVVLGLALRALDIPIGRIWSGEFCRTRDTASLLGLGEIAACVELTEGGIVVSERENKRRAGALRKFLATAPPAGTNTLIVSHDTNLEEAVGKEFSDIHEGEAIVFMP